MGSIKEFQFHGCLGRHGSYSFYKSIKIDGRILSLASFFPVRIYPDSAILSIAEVQLLWSDRTENFVGLRLYFLPENTPEGRKRHHGEDEVIALQDKVILRAGDLSSWLVDESDWDWGFVCPSAGIKEESNSGTSSISPASPTKSSKSDLSTKGDKTLESGSNRVVVLGYEKYVRVRTILKRLEGSKTDLSNWLSHPLVLALGGINISPSSRILFSKEVFDYPELEDHELLCNHLAPKLKGRPRKKRKRDRSLGSESNNSSSSTTSGGSEGKKPINGLGKSRGRPSNQDLDKDSKFPVSPKSISPPVSHPSSPSATSSETGQDKETPFGMIANSTGELQITKIEPGDSKENNGKLPVKIDNFHPGKKRNLPKAGSNTSTPSPHAASISPLDPKIELESTTIRFSRSPSTVVGSQQSDTKNNGLLEQSIVELAQKLEKSNALQILPVRPSVIAMQELNNGDSEFTRSTPPFKKRKTDEYKSTSSITISEKLVPVLGIDKSNSKSNMHNLPKNINGKHKIDKIISNNHLTKTDMPQPQPAHLNTQPSVSRPISKNEKIDEAKSFDVDSRRNVPPQKWTSPCPYLPTTKIFGDPAITKQSKPEPLGAKSSVGRLDKTLVNGLRSGSSNGPSTQLPQDVLDFSMKRTSEPKASPQALSVNVNVNVNLDSECLDLSVRPQSHKSKHVFHSISDIPPPNAMNQLGLRLTSEVTLFPSMQQEGQQRGRSSSTSGKSSTRVRDRDSLINPNHQAVKSASNQNMSSSTNRSHHLPSRSPLNDPIPKNINNFPQNPNPHVWRPGSSVTPSSSTPPNSQQRGAKDLLNPNSNPQVNRSSKSKSPTQHTINNIDRSQASSRGPSSKPSPTLNLNHSQPEMDPRINLQQLAQCYSPFMFPGPFGFPGQDHRPQLDPAYLSMLSMQFPPLMGMPPGMDSLHHYIQQGMIPPPNWAPFSLQPPPASKSPRGGPK